MSLNRVRIYSGLGDPNCRRVTIVFSTNAPKCTTLAWSFYKEKLKIILWLQDKKASLPSGATGTFSPTERNTFPCWRKKRFTAYGEDENDNKWQLTLWIISPFYPMKKAITTDQAQFPWTSPACVCGNPPWSPVGKQQSSGWCHWMKEGPRRDTFSSGHDVTSLDQMTDCTQIWTVTMHSFIYFLVSRINV